MTFFAPFCIPFMVGAAVMFVVLLWKWGSWLYLLPRADKKRILFGLPTRRTLAAVWEVISESLLHRRAYRSGVKRTRLRSVCAAHRIYYGK